MNDMTAEEIDGLPPLEQSRLTDVELNDIITDHAECGWEGDDGCPHCKMANELVVLRSEGVTHHATACMTCEATESELIALRAELELARATYETTLQADTELQAELREQLQQEIADATTVVALYAERDVLREQNAKLVAALALAIQWLRRLEQTHPGCLNDDAIAKHLLPVLVSAKGDMDKLLPNDELNRLIARLGQPIPPSSATIPAKQFKAVLEELRERRQAMSMCADVEADLAELREVIIAQDASIVERDIALRELREQNAKLVAALEEYGDHLPQRVGEDCLGPVWDSETKTLSYRPCVCGFDAALASVKGEPPRYGFNCEPGCPGCPNCEGTA